MKVPAHQFILSSGSLYLSPPQLRKNASGLRQTVLNHLKGLGDFDLHTAPASKIIEAVTQSRIRSWFLLMEPRLEGWENTTRSAQRLFLSDVQKEVGIIWCRDKDKDTNFRQSAIWQEGIWSTNVDAIVSGFDLAGDYSYDLKRQYHIYPDRPSSCKIGALDFINDYKFVLPVERLVQLWRIAKKPVFRCLLDEVNPWQPSSGAHHAVDLILLFGGFDLSFSHAAQQTDRMMRDKWIDFVQSRDPWPSHAYVAFGPHGSFQELDDNGIVSRRRTEQVEYLKTVETAVLDKVFLSLASGKISLLN